MPKNEATATAGRKLRILVVDDETIIREPITAALKGAGYDVLNASSGAEALRKIEIEKPDLIVLDVHMPGMDGMGVLSLLRQQPDTAKLPVILLTVEADRRFVLQATKLGVRDYVLKTRFVLKEFLQRIQKCLSVEPKDPSPATKPGAQATRAITDLPVLSTREKLIERAEKALNGRTLSGVVAQVISMAASPRTSMSDLSALIVRDPMLSANVLRVANSAAYGSSKASITTIPDAIRQVGCAVVGQLAAAIAVIDVMPETPADGFSPVRAWQHSFAVAQLCQRLMPPSDDTGGVAYLVGLCHDLADILFHSHFGAECQQIFEAQRQTGRSRGEVERAMLGMTHSDLVPVVLGKIGLPQAIRTPIANFHNALSAGKMPAEPLTQLLWLADLYANGVLLASSAESVVAPVERAACRKAGGAMNPACLDASDLRAEVFCLTAVLARLSPQEDAKLASPLFTKRNARLWLARDKAFSSFDPLAAALASLADVVISDRLPSDEEAKQVQGIVVATATADGCSGISPVELQALGGRQPALCILWLANTLSQSGPIQPRMFPVTLAELAQFTQVAEANGVRMAA